MKGKKGMNIPNSVFNKLLSLPVMNYEQLPKECSFRAAILSGHFPGNIKRNHKPLEPQK